MIFAEIENLLGERLGFDIDTIGQRALDTVIQRSMAKAGFSDPQKYARLLAQDSEAWQQLVDRVVIPETWFFRDQAPYDLAADLACAYLGGVLRSGAAKPLRILSCPCSTGEEPYSLAMTALEAGVRPDSLRIDAVDISRRAIETARARMFRKRSFRGDSRWDRQVHFEKIGDDGSWRLSSAVASIVHFRQGNLIDPGFLSEEEPYDIVFCRNLLIYLHPNARLLAMAALRRLVAENGVLVLGHAEAVFARLHGFKPTGPAAAFALVKDAPEKIVAAPRTPTPIAATSAQTAAKRPGATAFPAAPAASAVRDQRDFSKLALARQLGDAGQLDEAVRACHEFLQSAPDSAEGYFLLGILHDALGSCDLATSDFRKVLYLDPSHHDALLHLALKREALGDRSGAALLRARAQRVNVGARE